MKTNNFIEQLKGLSEAAHGFIKNNVDTKVVLATDDELEKQESLLNELPIISTVDKHGYYEEYAVIAVEKRNAEIIVHTRGKGDVNDGKREFDISEMDTSNVCFLADEIEIKCRLAQE